MEENQLWSDERITNMAYVDGYDWKTIIDAMREEYEEKIAELNHANTRLIEVDLEEKAARIDELEKIVMSVQSTANWEINALEKHNLDARIAEQDQEIDALKRECNLLYASLSQPGKYRLPPKDDDDVTVQLLNCG